MGLFDLKQDFSDKNLEFALRNNIFHEYILMAPSCTCNDEKLKYDRYNILKSIYKYHKKHPGEEINQKLYDTLIMLSRKYCGEHAVESVLDTVKCQLDFEKQGKAPFKINCHDVLTILKYTIEANKNMYTQKKSMFQKPFWNTIEEYNQELSDEYGHKVL